MVGRPAALGNRASIVPSVAITLRVMELHHAERDGYTNTKKSQRNLAQHPLKSQLVDFTSR
jgi:hypothetical protein